jgi:mRNA interferase RelE/StbE
LPESDKTLARQRVKELLENPYLGLRLKGELDGFWKDRIGVYRLIYKINESGKEIIFYDVDLRKRVYD